MEKEKKDFLLITGGKPLSGEIELRGAKNCVPKEMVASLLTSESCTLRNVSRVTDTDLVSRMIGLYGGKVEDLSKTEIKIEASDIKPKSQTEMQAFAGKSRIPILFCGPLLHRFGEAMIPDLGGCAIGKRPVNFHISALAQMGAEIIEKEEGTLLRAKKLRGAKILLEYPSVGTTEQIIMTAVLAEGITEVKNAAIEPEIMDLICLLQKMGAVISVDADRTIRILGVSKLGGFDHSALPDRIEAASWACVALITGGKIKVVNAKQLDMLTFLNKFKQVGGGFEVCDDGIVFWKDSDTLSPVTVETDVHPGFMTDWQQPLVLALTQAVGASVVHETVYEDRFGYTKALNEMGAQIQLFRDCLGSVSCRFGQRNHLHSAIIVGPKKLKASEITIPDLRAGFTYVAAALIADGTSKVNNIELIDRGYEDFEEKLRTIRADVK